MRETMISIVMLTYNHEQYVEQALNSILMQDVNIRYEIMIGDDCSSDSTQKILRRYKKKFPDKINLFLRKKNIGATNNFWDLLSNCQGKYIALLEGDDFWNNKSKLQEQFTLLEQNREFIGTAHKSLMCDEFGEELKNRFYPIEEGFLRIDDLVKLGILYHTSSLMFKNIFKDTGDKYKKLLTSHNMVGDFPLSVLLLSMGFIYMMKEDYSTHRVIINSYGTNAKSVSQRNKMRSAVSQLKQIFEIEEYFDDKYKFTNKKVKLVLTLYYSFLPKVSSYTEIDKKEAIFVLKKIELRVKFKALTRALIYPFKKLLRGIKKLLLNWKYLSRQKS